MLIIGLSLLFLLSTALTVSFGVRYIEAKRLPLLEMTHQADSVATLMADYYRTATAQPSVTPSPTPTSSASLSAPKLLLLPHLNPRQSYAKELQDALSWLKLTFQPGKALIRM